MGLLYTLKVSPLGKWCWAQATKKRNSLMKAHLPQLPSCLVLLPRTQTCPHIREHLLHKSPFVETRGKFRPTWVHKPFSLLELRQIKQDLGSYTDDPGKYVDTFQHITLAFDLTWKDIMVIFSQSLSDPEHTRVLKEAQKYATGLHMSSDRYPVGEPAVLPLLS